MSQKDTFLKILDEQFENYTMEKMAGLKTSILLSEKDGFDFDVDTAFAEWANNVSVDYLIIDVACATQKDIDAIVTQWDKPTAYLFKNYGDETAENFRNKISVFIKDRYLGIRCVDDPAPQVVLCATTVSKDKPIRDFGERQVFLSYYDF